MALPARHPPKLCVTGQFFCAKRDAAHRAVAAQQGLNPRCPVQAARDGALAREAALASEKAALKAGLGGALEAKAGLESAAAAAAAMHQRLQSQARLPALADAPIYHSGPRVEEQAAAAAARNWKTGHSS